MVLSLKPFNAFNLSTVVLNLREIAQSVSPCDTVYVPALELAG